MCCLHVRTCACTIRVSKMWQIPCTIVQGICQILPEMKRREFSILLHFKIHIHVLMLHIKFELILIKIGFFTNF